MNTKEKSPEKAGKKGGRPQKLLQTLRRRWRMALILLVLLAIGAWYYWQQQNQPLEGTFEQPVIEDLTRYLEVSGVVDAKEKARLRFIAGGKVTYLGATEGDSVEKWQTIASIDKAALSKQLDQDLNNYLKERWDFEQYQDDTGDYDLLELETRRDWDKEQWDLENTVLNVEIRDIAIRNASLYAPFAGVLTTSPTEVTGVQLLASDYFEIVNPETLVFRAQIDEADLAQVELGQEGLLELDAYEDEIFETTVDYIAYTSSQSSSGTVFLVDLPLPSDLDRYRLGMNGDVRIELETKTQVMTLPFEAIRFEDGQPYVEVKVSESKTEPRQVETGLETDDRVEILSGLSTEDQVLIPD